MLTHLWKVSKWVFKKAATFLWKIVKCDQEQKQLNMVAHKQVKEEKQMTKELDQNEDGMKEGEQIGASMMRICMSDDVWFDVFDFLERIQLARTVSLTNWHIHQICWPRLHVKKVATHDVDEIIIKRKRRDKYECCRCRPSSTALLLKDGKEMSWPNCPPPAYISTFKNIKINVTLAVDDNGYVQMPMSIESFGVSDTKLICYPNLMMPSSEGNAKMAKRFRKEEMPMPVEMDKWKEICKSSAATIDAHQKIATHWEPLVIQKLPVPDDRIRMNTSYGTICTAKKSSPLKIKVSGVVTPLIGPIECEEKNGMAISEQLASGAFLTDYPTMLFPRVLANGQNHSNLSSCEKNYQKKSDKFLLIGLDEKSTIVPQYSTRVTPKTNSPKKNSGIVVKMTCKAFEKYVKLPFMNDGQPEYATRFGYIFNENFAGEENQFLASKQAMREFFTGKDSDWQNVGENDKEMFEAILFQEGQFRYINVSTTLVNRHGIIRMHFHKCDNVTFGVFMNEKPTDPDIFTVEEKYNWSKDFEDLNIDIICGKTQLWRDGMLSGLQGSVHVPQKDPHEYAITYSENYNFNLRFDPDNLLPIEIGVKSKEGKEPTPVHLEAHRYYYGFMDDPFPQREIMREAQNGDGEVVYRRSQEFGRYLTDLREIYKPLQTHTMWVEFEKIAWKDVLPYFPIYWEEIKWTMVRPQLLQQIYKCASADHVYNIYTSRFRAHQLVEFYFKGKMRRFAFVHKTVGIQLDDNYYPWTADPGDIFLKKRKIGGDD